MLGPFVDFVERALNQLGVEGGQLLAVLALLLVLGFLYLFYGKAVQEAQRQRREKNEGRRRVIVIALKEMQDKVNFAMRFIGAYVYSGGEVVEPPGYGYKHILPDLLPPGIESPFHPANLLDDFATTFDRVRVDLPQDVRALIEKLHKNLLAVLHIVNTSVRGQDTSDAKVKAVHDAAKHCWQAKIEPLQADIEKRIRRYRHGRFILFFRM